MAARYIAWVHASLGIDAPNPLSGWLKELDAAIHEHYPGYDPHRLFRGAEREVFTLVGLYATALLGWIEDSSATLLLNIAATGCSNASSRSKPELAARLAEQRKHLRVWAAVIKIIQDDHLKESVLPAAMRCALTSSNSNSVPPWPEMHPSAHRHRKRKRQRPKRDRG